MDIQTSATKLGEKVRCLLECFTGEPNTTHLGNVQEIEFYDETIGGKVKLFLHQDGDKIVMVADIISGHKTVYWGFGIHFWDGENEMPGGGFPGLFIRTDEKGKGSLRILLNDCRYKHMLPAKGRNVYVSMTGVGGFMC
jgi:hypothetical protein